jgi:calcineurin-like phosphoesterase family protein
MMRAVARYAGAAMLAGATACGSNPSGPDPIPPPPSGPQTLVGAGDIGWCGLAGTEATGRLLDSIGGTVFAAGDNAYPNGTAQNFAQCYDPGWGRHKSRTYAVPGNHDYETPGASAYFAYFGDRAGPLGLGYYSFSLGAWHVITLNSEIATDGASPQVAWLKSDLAANSRTCTAVIWHKPLYSSGPNGDNLFMRDIWRVLYDANVDVVINGHDHDYERFAPQDADGHRDSLRGIRQFVAGTGGAQLYNFTTPHTNSEAWLSVWGVLQLTLRANDYDWRFVPIAGQSSSDVGSDRCH